jgi:hypothetical protein
LNIKGILVYKTSTFLVFKSFISLPQTLHWKNKCDTQLNTAKLTRCLSSPLQLNKSDSSKRNQGCWANGFWPKDVKPHLVPQLLLEEHFVKDIWSRHTLVKRLIYQLYTELNKPQPMLHKYFIGQALCRSNSFRPKDVSPAIWPKVVSLCQNTVLWNYNSKT